VRPFAVIAVGIGFHHGRVSALTACAVTALLLPDAVYYLPGLTLGYLRDRPMGQQADDAYVFSTIAVRRLSYVSSGIFSSAQP
jgi:hypothetical protein